MQLKLVKNDALQKQASLRDGCFQDLGTEQQDLIIQQSVASGDFSYLETMTNEYTGIYDFDEHKPFWLQSDFYASKWLISLNKLENVIRWDLVILDDGKPLTSPKHKPLLNAFKYWLVSLSNPIENGGKLLKKSTIMLRMRICVSLINAFLLNAKAIKLAELHFSAITNSFLMDILVRIAGNSGIKDGIYDYTSRLRMFLIDKASEVSNEDADTFQVLYPYVSRELIPEEQELQIEIKERVKICTWLHKNGYYLGNNYVASNTPLSSKLFDDLYSNNTIYLSGKPSFSIFAELALEPANRGQEFRAVPNRNNDNHMIGANRIHEFIGILKMLSIIDGKTNCPNLPSNALQNITVKRVNAHVRMKSCGRYKTLPPKLVFKSIDQAYNFCFKHMDSILESLLKVIGAAPKGGKRVSRKAKDNKWGTDSAMELWKKSELLECLDGHLINIGVEELRIKNNIQNTHQKRRSNKGLIDLHQVLLGAIQILTGALMARRQGELIDLKPSKNLVPNVNPASEGGLTTEYKLRFKAKKSGFGGEHGQSHIEDRPIPHSVALLIYKLEQFNKKAIALTKQAKSKVGLFASIDPRSLILNKAEPTHYNLCLDAFCDYFETDTIVYENGYTYRYYIRQHQLRRFFAMVFFWSKQYSGLDSLRWMLGHTDMEHLYHYITEPEQGGVLNTIKARYLTEKLLSDELDHVDKLKELLGKQYGVDSSNIFFSSLSNAVSIYDDEDYQTVPTIEKIRNQEKLENQVLELLDGDLITLEPEFSSVKKNGEVIQEINFILQVKELD